MISGFRHEVAENLVIVGYYAVTTTLRVIAQKNKVLTFTCGLYIGRNIPEDGLF